MPAVAKTAALLLHRHRRAEWKKKNDSGLLVSNMKYEIKSTGIMLYPAAFQSTSTLICTNETPYIKSSRLEDIVSFKLVANTQMRNFATRSILIYDATI